MTDPGNWFNELSFKDTDIIVEEIPEALLDRIEFFTNLDNVDSLLDEAMRCGVDYGKSIISKYKGVSDKYLKAYEARRDVLKIKVEKICGVKL